MPLFLPLHFLCSCWTRSSSSISSSSTVASCHRAYTHKKACFASFSLSAFSQRARASACVSPFYLIIGTPGMSAISVPRIHFHLWPMPAHQYTRARARAHRLHAIYRRALSRYVFAAARVVLFCLFLPAAGFFCSLLACRRARIDDRRAAYGARLWLLRDAADGYLCCRGLIRFCAFCALARARAQKVD